MLIGEFLIQKKLITEGQLVAGLKRHFQSHLKIGECLILDGSIEEKVLLMALSELLDIAYFDEIPLHLITEDSMTLFPLRMATNLCVIASESENKMGFMVFCNDQLDEVKAHLLLSDAKATIGLAKKSHIRQAIDKVYVQKHMQ